MRIRDPRVFNIADAGTGTDPGTSPSGADGAGAGAGGVGGETDPPAPVFADWTGESLAPAIPEGFELTEDQSAKLLEIVNGSKGDPAGIVKGLLSYYTEVAEQSAQELARTFNETQAKWQDEMRADPDYGGSKFDESLRIAKETAIRLGGNEFLDVLRATGAGNSVHMLRFLMKASALIPKEATPADGRPSAQPKTLGDKLFGPKA